MATADRSSVRAAVDVGGTLIDLVMVDLRTGATTIEKQPSTPDRLADEIVDGMNRLPSPIAGVGRQPARHAQGTATICVRSPARSRTSARRLDDRQGPGGNRVRSR